MADITHIGGKSIVWSDAAGALHAVEGADVHPGVRLLWPRCGHGDVPADQAWLQRPEDTVSCPGCLAAIAEALRNG